MRVDGVLHALRRGEDIRARFAFLLDFRQTDRPCREIDEEFLHHASRPIGMKCFFLHSEADLVVIISGLRLHPQLLRQIAR